MPTIRTDGKASERLLSIDWGKPDSERRQPVQHPDLNATNVCVRIDEVFHHINAYRALIDAEVAGEGLLARSLINQANAVFNQAFVNLEARHKFARVYVDGPVNPRQGAVDITDLVIEEVIALQNILDS